MHISQMSDSKESPVSCKAKPKKNTWDAKRLLVTKRLMDLSQNMEDGESGNMDLDLPIVNYQAKAKETTLPNDDAKRKNRHPVKKRRLVLAEETDDEESEEMDMPIVCYKAKENTTSVPNSSVDVSVCALERAEEVQANLSPLFPSFVKTMLHSHIRGGFWLGLPRKFCVTHLPKEDATMVLVDEDEQESDAKYLANKNGLSGGWRGFSIAHGLLDGDVLVFQLIEPRKFKIYIVRVSRLTEVDGAISLLSLDSHAMNTVEDQREESAQTSGTEKQKVLEPPVVDNDKERNMPIVISDNEDQRGNDSDMNSGCEFVEGIRLSESVVNFKDVKSFQDFTIHVNGLIIDSEIPSHTRKLYYKLCLSQNMFLHEKLIEGLNIKLVTGIISETINIADAIRAVKPATSLDHLESWDKTLKAFEQLGMVVAFLRARIQKLLSLFTESQAVIESKRSERAEAENEKRTLVEKLCNVGALIKKLDEEIDALKEKNKELNSVFTEVAGASW